MQQNDPINQTFQSMMIRQCLKFPNISVIPTVDDHNFPPPPPLRLSEEITFFSSRNSTHPEHRSQIPSSLRPHLTSFLPSPPPPPPKLETACAQVVKTSARSLVSATTRSENKHRFPAGGRARRCRSAGLRRARSSKQSVAGDGATEATAEEERRRQRRAQTVAGQATGERGAATGYITMEWNGGVGWRN